ncbi:MAG: hypothetical protein QOC64_1897 [Solirubrobacteraceae bacterium]|nr:hypothetical protein [Solirubrobacteraceae bacterium]
MDTSTDPRVTLGVATYQRDTYLAEAVGSCLAQDYEDLEVLVVVDGAGNARIDAVLAGFSDPRLRIVRHPSNRGIAEAYNTIVREGRGELIAMLGDDDVSMPDRISRQVALFDAHPDTAVVHGNALIIDGDGRPVGTWPSADFTPDELFRYMTRVHNPIVDPSRMVHRRVYDAVGGYKSAYTVAQDFEFWLRAAPGFRFRHVPGEPLIHLRRHGDNYSDESNFAKEVAQVEDALAEAFDRVDLELLVPELDWAAPEPAVARVRALHLLADALDARAVPAHCLAAELRRRARDLAAPAAAPDDTAPGDLDGQPIVLATPAWRGADRLPELLAAWARAATTGTLVLLADPGIDGEEGLEVRVLGAAEEAGVDLDRCADVEIRILPGNPGRDARLYEACAAYVPLHAGCARFARLARVCGSPVVAPEADALTAVLGDPVLDGAR